MFDRRYKPYLHTLMLSSLMSGLMSCLVLWVNFGWGEGFTVTWIKSWSLSFLLGYPLVSVINPMTDKLVTLLLRE
jgi:hypothetical protein